jgi:exodeoxyribonuclease V gamma subunit
MYEAAQRVGSGARIDSPLVSNPLDEIQADDQVDLQQFLYFFTNPPRGFADNRLDLELDRAQQLPEDREQFTLGLFDRLALEHELVDRLLNEQSPVLLYELLQARGQLPHGRVGEQIFRAMEQGAMAMVQRIRRLDKRDLLHPLAVDLQFGDYRLTGHLHGASPGGLLAFSTQRLYPFQMIMYWISHLVLNALDPPGVKRVTRLLEQGRDGHYRPVEQAVAQLSKLMDYYHQGLHLPLTFYPATAWAYLERAQRGDEERARKAAQQRWFGNPYQGGDLDKPYQRLFWPNRPVLDDGFFEISRELLQPLMDHLEWLP